ncbi:MAG: PQQ-binding-like beta-propeller repeat protein [Verrucomicrobiales bacterium]|nr:PQQ-binding-like beta-propeller repeat protein [Verrucomicrobiales bacterium]
MKPNLIVVFGSLSLFFSSFSTFAEDWLRFRGPNGTGIYDGKKTVPTTWSEGGENVKWKVELPGKGISSPILVGDKIFLTTWSGYGIDLENAGEQENLQRHLVCLNRKTGEEIWNKAVKAELPEDRWGGMIAQHGYASHTPVSDGERVYVFYGKTGVYAYDLDGNELWNKSVGTGRDPRGWGTASSPILHKNLLIVNAAIEDRAIYAFDKKTGEEVWKQQVDSLTDVWSTPVLVEAGEGEERRTDLIVPVPYEVWGMNPETGKLRWYCEGINSSNVSSSPAVDGDTVYIVGGRNGGALAVKAGGKGDVTKSHVLWSDTIRGRIVSPVVHKNQLAFVRDGIITCLDKKTGDEIYRARVEANAPQPAKLAFNGGSEEFFPVQNPRGKGGGSGRGFGRGGYGGGGQDYASPVLINGKIYAFNHRGECVVAELGGTEFKQIAFNRLGDGGQTWFHATPAVVDGEMFVRSMTSLYCISAARETE